MGKLKPCPFCGTEGEWLAYFIGKITRKNEVYHGCSIQCLKCNAEIGIDYMFGSSDEAIKSAEKKWNTRYDNMLTKEETEL